MGHLLHVTQRKTIFLILLGIYSDRAMSNLVKQQYNDVLGGHLCYFEGQRILFDCCLSNDIFMHANISCYTVTDRLTH